jgi:hypothetical protein
VRRSEADVARGYRLIEARRVGQGSDVRFRDALPDVRFVMSED